jgi:hypothetical protein
VAGNNIQIVLDTGDDDIGDDGVETLREAVVSAGRALISEFDDEATGTYAVVAQGATDASASTAWGAVGQAKVDDGDIDGAIDYTPQGDDPTSAVLLSGSVDAQNGSLSLAGLNSQDTTTAEDFAYFPIDENRTVAIEISGQQLGLVWLEATRADGGGGDDDD